jgi:hypothetical protein
LIRGRFERGEPVVDCFILIPALGIDVPERVTLLVDTGASVSALHPADVRRFGADPAKIVADPRSELVGGVGGSTRVLVTTTLLSFAENTAGERRYRQRMGITEPTSSNITMPSILGMDFFRNFRLTVSVREDRVELEPMFDEG